MKWNQQLVKVNNKQKILQAIQTHAPISRADIAQMLELTKGTVSSLVNELLEAKITYESGPGESSGGRRPVLLLFNEKAGYSIGIDLGVNYILGVLTDLNGEIIHEQKQTIHQTDYPYVLNKLRQTIQELIASAPDSPYGVVGIGIGVPGIVDNEGIILLAPNLGWKNIDLQQDLAQEFNLPITIENEANAGANGEKQFGAGQAFDHLIYISAGIGIGVGLILNGELYRGANGFSGEMGHMMIEKEGKVCRCGSKGCWELYASENALIQNAIRIGEQEETTLEALIEKAETDEAIRDLFHEIGAYLGIGITNISNTFNPEQIIIGNRLAIAKDLLQESITENIAVHTLKYNQANLKISFSELAFYSAALGASAYAIESFLNLQDANLIA